ncbi:putative quinol monooxygenase [Sphingomonas sp. ERG5]|uniref:putative quinol monooxygenase n=1 Tax=Sphingomonas sp. ERG5 TaxID=1381597 RepID=UPI000690BCE9|nr:antibiotic biosynthesis monooxygenase [Sphingomonas sp. ERG5]
MIIIAGYTRTAAEARDNAVAAHAPMVARARIHHGCLDLAISADAIDPERINVFERWADQASLDAWRKIANPPDVSRRETHVSLFHTEQAESPF